MSDVTIPGGKIRAFVERVENLDTEIQELNKRRKCLRKPKAKGST
jgi:uncharacterized protein (UPF0335 family)